MTYGYDYNYDNSIYDCPYDWITVVMLSYSQFYQLEVDFRPIGEWLMHIYS